MECRFQVGQKVVCVNSAGFSETLKEGSIYTVTGLVPAALSYSFDGLNFVPGVRLFGLKNPYGMDAFDYRRFRPAVSRSTDKGMSILRGLLDKADKPVKVTA